MKTICCIVVMSFSFSIILLNSDNINIVNKQDKISSKTKTILLEIKAWKYTENNNFIYHLNNNPHLFYQIYENNKLFFNMDLILNNIYTDILVGTPPVFLLGFFSGKLNTFQVFFFNSSKSSTFKELNNDRKNNKCSDNFIFNCENKLYQLREMEFIRTYYSSLKLSHSFLGLQISTKDIKKMKEKNELYNNQSIINFVESLQKAHCKELNISNYYWTIKYYQTPKNNTNQIIDGIFYFGEPPHIYDPANYNEEDFIEINTEAGYENIYWGIKFDYIDLINKTTGKAINAGKYATKEYCLIYPELNYFITSEKFFSRIKQAFFNKFTFRKKNKNYNSSICFEQFVSLIDDINLLSLNNFNDLKGVYDTFYCEKKKVVEYGEEKFYKEFPIIKFHHLILEKSFEFDAKDLFYEKNEKLYFMMTIKLDRGDYWIFGKTFMKKYQIIFNNDMRTLGFYFKDNKLKKVKNPNEIINYIDKQNNRNIFMLIICFIFIFITSFCLIRLYCIKNRIWIFKDKRNANELELINNKYKEIL